jgi:hypothetical protein
VEETAVDTVGINVDGCELLFGSAYGLANEIARWAIRPKSSGGLGCKVNVALAGNPDAAIHAAKFFKGITFITPGEEITGLGDLPIESLCFELVGVEEKKRAGASGSQETQSSWSIHSQPSNRSLSFLHACSINSFPYLFEDASSTPVRGLLPVIGGRIVSTG